VFGNKAGALVAGDGSERESANAGRIDSGRSSKYCLLLVHEWQPRQVIAYLELLIRAFLGRVTCTSLNVITASLMGASENSRQSSLDSFLIRCANVVCEPACDAR
jgi:hypothetical protein